MIAAAASEVATPEVTWPGADKMADDAAQASIAPSSELESEPETEDSFQG